MRIATLIGVLPGVGRGPFRHRATASGVPASGFPGGTPGPNPAPGQSAGTPTGTRPGPAPGPTTPAGEKRCQTWVYPTYIKVSGSNDSKPSFGLLACTKVSGNQVYGGFEYQSNSSAATVGGGYSFKVSMLLRNCEHPNEQRADTTQQVSGTVNSQGSWWYKFPLTVTEPVYITMTFPDGVIVDDPTGTRWKATPINMYSSCWEP